MYGMLQLLVIPLKFSSKACFCDSSAHKNYFLGTWMKTHLHFRNTYSWPCLHQWLETRPNRQVCPVCKAAISKEKVVPLYGRGSTKQEDPRLIHCTIELCMLIYGLVSDMSGSKFCLTVSTILCNLYLDFI